jgi:hypothetical protein
MPNDPEAPEQSEHIHDLPVKDVTEVREADAVKGGGLEKFIEIIAVKSTGTPTPGTFRPSANDS